MFFLLFLLDDRRIRILISELMDPDLDSGGPKTYESYGSGSASLNDSLIYLSCEPDINSISLLNFKPPSDQSLFIVNN
jgi:hypothetical protein